MLCAVFLGGEQWRRVAGGGEVDDRDEELPEPEDLRLREGYRPLASLEVILPREEDIWEGLVDCIMLDWR
jgi:hypothetical protein